MNIFVYADESGVFDYKHNKVFVFGGLIFLDKDEKDSAQRLYIAAEKVQRDNGAARGHSEMKAIYLENKQKYSMFRSMNHYHRFGVVVEQEHVNKKIFDNKKTKQRYLDYAFKIAVKSELQKMLYNNEICKNSIENIYVFMDEHTTATNGRYELREALENEFKNGTYNMTWEKYFPPLFPGMKSVDLKLKDSKQDALIRAADIVANRLYWAASNKNYNQVKNSIDFIFLPKQHEC